jgi:hypothetical protein
MSDNVTKECAVIGYHGGRHETIEPTMVFRWKNGVLMQAFAHMEHFQGMTDIRQWRTWKPVPEMSAEDEES